MKKPLVYTSAWILLASVFTTPSFAQTALDKIKAKGHVSFGVREQSGLGFSLGNGKYVGFHTEMGERIIADIAKYLKKPLKIVYTPITSQNRIALLQNGTIDFECGSTTNNKTRAKQAAFAYTTFLEETRFVVRANSGIKSLADLAGKTIATTTGTTSVSLLRKYQRTNKVRFRELTGKDHGDSFLLLQTGRADAFMMDASILAAQIARSKNPKAYRILGDVLSLEPIACMLPKDEPELMAVVNASIARQIKDGSLEKLYHRWFVKPIPPNNVSLNLPLSPNTRYAWDNLNSKPLEDYPENK